MNNVTLEEVLAYTQDELNRIAKKASIELDMVEVPDDFYNVSCNLDERDILIYTAVEDYLELYESNYDLFISSIQGGLRDMAIKVYALTHSSLELIDENTLGWLQKLIEDEGTFSVRGDFATPETASFLGALAAHL